jgi:hypothetical protein
MVERAKENLEQRVVSEEMALVPERLRKQAKGISGRIKKHSDRERIMKAFNHGLLMMR